ncbi:MAG: hypothetical protein HY870_08895 [Chloroflexi bacterium]|nr:hypothetical protein [Chloroflexota bacterium]
MSACHLVTRCASANGGIPIPAQLFLQLDRAAATYRPGDLIRGSLRVVASSELRTRGIMLHAIGDEVTSLGPNVVMTEHTHPFNLSFSLWSPGAEQDKLPVGEHTFPFEFALPANLPPTFKGELTTIAYRLEAKINRLLATDLHAEQQLIVRVPPPVDADKPVRASVSSTTGLTLELELKASGYCPGDHVAGTLHLIGTPPAIKSAIVDVYSREKGEAREFADHVEHVRVRAEIDPAQFSGGVPCPIDLPLPDDADPSFVAQHSSKTRYVRAQLTLADGHTLTTEAIIRVGQRINDQ